MVLGTSNPRLESSHRSSAVDGAIAQQPAADSKVHFSLPTRYRRYLYRELASPSRSVVPGQPVPQERIVHPESCTTNPISLRIGNGSAQGMAALVQRACPVPPSSSRWPRNHSGFSRPWLAQNSAMRRNGIHGVKPTRWYRCFMRCTPRRAGHRLAFGGDRLLGPHVVDQEGSQNRF
jgi:hypothetical protein